MHIASIHNNILLNSSPPNLSVTKHEIITNPQIELTKWVCMYCSRDFLIIEELQHHINTDHQALVNGNFLGSHGKNAVESPLTSNNNDLSLINDSHSDSAPTYACESCTMHFDSVDKLRVHENCIHWKPPIAASSKSFNKDCNPGLHPTQNFSGSEGLTNSNSIQPIQLQPTDLSRKRRGTDVEEKISPKRMNNNTTSVPNVTSSSHDSSKKEEWTSYICSICGTQLPNFASFMVHMDIHMSVSATPSNVILGGYCPLCGEAYRDQTELNNHIVLHTLTYKLGWCCRVCKKVFNDNLEDFQRHLMENHACTTYKCCVCEQLFESKTAMLVSVLFCHYLFVLTQLFSDALDQET